MNEKTDREIDAHAVRKAIQQTLATLTVGAAATSANLTVFPLYSSVVLKPEYLTLDEALALGFGHVTEMDAGGSVPELCFTNEGDRPVLLLDGEELLGAKQNRVLNLTILAPARSRIKIPVSCVEAGRWSARSVEFSASRYALFAKARAQKMEQVSHMLHESGVPRSNQQAVWNAIDEKAEQLDAASPTHAMADVFAQHHASLEEYLSAFSVAENQVGALFFVNGALIGGDLFDSPATLRKLFPKLLHSYALDALEKQGTPARSDDAVADSMQLEAQFFLEAIDKATLECFPAVGEGVDVRLHGQKLTGAALLALGRVIHLSAFRLDKDRKPKPPIIIY